MAAKLVSSSSAMTKLIPIGIIVVVVLGVVVFLFTGRSKAPVPAPAPNAAAPTAAPAPAAPAAEQALPELTSQQLLKEASTAMIEKRYVSPAGNNAFEYYERLLDKDPNNLTARDALRETFPMVIGVPEQEINAGNVDEAARVIGLLAKADPNNYTLTILRSKLDAKKKQVEREQTQAAAATAAAAKNQQQAAAAAAANPASTAAPAAAAPPPAAAAPAPAVDSAATAPAQATASAARTTPAASTAVPAAPAAGGETHPAEIVKTTPPDYPPEAVRKRQEGWVEVEFTVTSEGTVANATVVGAEPSRVFNTSAIRAVERWTFRPRMENGKAVEEKIRRRIEFKL